MGSRAPVTFDTFSRKISDKRTCHWCGEFHYWRLPSPDLWRDVLQKYKAAGFTAASVYSSWACHSPASGTYDFTGVRDIARLLDIASEVGIYIAARPGPYTNAETDSGGFHGWVDTEAGIARADGIVVPTFTNESRKWAPGTPGGADIYGFDSYPQNFNASHPTVWLQVPDYTVQRTEGSALNPLFLSEGQGGSFDPWDGPGYLVGSVRDVLQTVQLPDATSTNKNLRVRHMANPATLAQFFTILQADWTSTGYDTVNFELTLADQNYQSVPQVGSLIINGRDAKLLVAGYNVWINGQCAGDPTGSAVFAFPSGSIVAGQSKLIAVLTMNYGHNEDGSSNDRHKQPRGLTGYALQGSAAVRTWHIQGNQGGQEPIDPVHGPLNNGGLFGERNGWYLPGYPTASWHPVSLPATNSAPGITWYSTRVDLATPAGQDVSIGIQITDDRARDYNLRIYVNGWHMGRYVNNVGPQTNYVVPNGILNTDGPNTITIASISFADGTGGLGALSLTLLGNVLGGVPVSLVDSPTYQTIFG